MLRGPVAKLRQCTRHNSSVSLAFDVVKRAQSSGKGVSPLVIMHGLLGNKSNNRTLARYLRDSLGRDVYLVDMRNHGSSPHTASHTYSDMAGDIDRFVNDQGLERPVLVGHSMGAKAAMATALTYPDLASAIVCLDNAPVCTAPQGKYALYMTALERLCNNPQITTLQEADAAMVATEPDKFVRGFLLTVLKRVKAGDELRSWRFESRVPLGTLRQAVLQGEISAWPWDARRDRWSGPALFVRGTESHYMADEYIAATGMQFPRFELRDVKAGHYLNATHPRECADLITDFLERQQE